MVYIAYTAQYLPPHPHLPLLSSLFSPLSDVKPLLPCTPPPLPSSPAVHLKYQIDYFYNKQCVRKKEWYGAGGALPILRRYVPPPPPLFDSHTNARLRIFTETNFTVIVPTRAFCACCVVTHASCRKCSTTTRKGEFRPNARYSTRILTTLTRPTCYTAELGAAEVLC